MHSLRFARRAVVVSSLLVFAGHAHAQPSRTLIVNHQRPISSLPFTIDKCGSYVVTKCLTGVAGSHGIEVLADDVTIDLGGNSLLGVAGSQSAIFANGGVTRLTVRNGNVSGWGQGGVDASTASHVRLEGLAVTGCGTDGFSVGVSATIERCNASANQGAGVLAGKGACVRHSVVENHTTGGIKTGDNSLITDSRADNCGEVGIKAGSLSIVRGCNSQFNTGSPGDGIQVVEAGQVIDSIAFGNSNHGISVGGRSFVRGCGAHQNGARGISAFDVSTVVDCVTNGNDTGIFANAFCVVRSSLSHENGVGILSQESLIESNVVIGADFQGIFGKGADLIRGNVVNRSNNDAIRVADDCLVAGNLVRAAGFIDPLTSPGALPSGVVATGDDNRISDNHIVECPNGITAFGMFNTIYKNSLRDNLLNFAVSNNNDVGPVTTAADTDVDDFPFANIVPGSSTP